MVDFIIQDSSIACNTLEINNVNFPTVYVDNTYLKYTGSSGLIWDKGKIELLNINDSSNNNFYMILNESIGGPSVNNINNISRANTTNYIRAGLGSQSGGSDNLGTGLTYTSKGQLTIGLTDKDTLSDTPNTFGSSLTSHLSLTNKEVVIIDNKKNISYPIQGELDCQKSLFTSSKLDNKGLKIMEDGSWTDYNYTSEDLYNKTLHHPIIDGDITFFG